MKAKDRKRPLDAANSPPPPEKINYDNRIKRKNVLALNEKVAAIREYEKNPVYKRIGRMFHCSPDQIKRIVQQKDNILQAWEQRTRRCHDAKTLEMKVVRVSMLGKAVYEWIRRMMYYKDFIITDGLIQKMALQFKSAMGLQNFFPHQEWCDKFRQTYNITNNDSKMLTVGYTQGFSVQIKDVVKDVLTECTPESAGDKGKDEDEDNTDDLDNTDDNTDVNIDGDESDSDDEKPSSPNVTKSLPLPQLQTRILPQLQQIRQLVALPIQANRGLGTTQKVLVATPITHAGQTHCGAQPMAMTFIPLTTIAKPNLMSQQKTSSMEKPMLPAPMVDIKTEIKEEQIDIKQEYISDDENEGTMKDVAATSQSVSGVIEKDEERNKQSEFFTEPQSKNQELDYESSLASLRRIQTRSAKTKEPSATTSPTTEKSNKILTPPMPKLIKVPAKSALVTTRNTKRRKWTINTNDNKNNNGDNSLPAITSCSEARKYLKLLEDFALYKENFRLIGLITRADEVLRELDEDQDVDID